MENNLVIQKTEKNLSTGITLSLFIDKQPNKAIIKKIEKDLKTLDKIALQLPHIRLIAFNKHTNLPNHYESIDMATFNFLCKKYNINKDMQKESKDSISFYAYLPTKSGASLNISSETITIETN
jgi:hypothetical protein